ncbi:HAD family hydrolase [Proteiniclasticum ruminis]|uniref:HAD family hydrolase n=1 Tax=Proteiniclasticum ruminis TaxID=398199 RepID=UPI00289ECFF5|nr:HAD family hydrolase [Proteiniclasticum ruminis]
MKKINTILFDLDGTLLSIDMKEFEEIYYTSLSNAFKSIIAPDNFMAILYSSMKAMVKNKENRTNEEVFMSVMKERVGEELPAFQKHFIHYYENDFSVLRDAVNKNTDMLEALKILKEKGYELVIATNPLFPKFAIDQRIQWAELVHEDFSHITYFEDSHYCKPNVEYYSEILETIGKNPQECMMVGNDAEEDLAAGALGITTYLITNHLLNRKSLEYTADHEGTYKDFLMFAESMPDVQ